MSATLDWQGVLLGHGEDRQNLESLVSAHPFKDRIELLVTSDQFPRQVAALDLGLVFATGSDGGSRPALEMLSCGVPLLLADLPGLRELGEGNTGARVLPAPDLDAWARACEEWVRVPDARRQAGATARRMAQERHALAVRGKCLAEFYGRAL
jgi:glycosyltransferase involved in cell wall biosynthesis